MEKVINSLKQEISKHVDPKHAEKIGIYFKLDTTKYLGLRTPLIRKISKEYFKEVKHLDLDEIFKIADKLLDEHVWEYKVIAFDWVHKKKKEFREEHFEIFERWFDDHIEDWGDCDDLCSHAFGEFLVKYPEFVNKTNKWVKDSRPMKRRAAAVCLIFGLRRGFFFENIFGIADELNKDKEDLVLKGSGWMLKEATKHFEDEVVEYLVENESKMPRLVFRYAIEKLDKAKKDKLMGK